jgi:hypothetical protein
VYEVDEIELVEGCVPIVSVRIVSVKEPMEVPSPLMLSVPAPEVLVENSVRI